MRSVSQKKCNDTVKESAAANFLLQLGKSATETIVISKNVYLDALSKSINFTIRFWVLKESMEDQILWSSFDRVNQWFSDGLLKRDIDFVDIFIRFWR